MSGCHEFIEALEHGYRRCGRRGCLPSGGERQRIAIGVSAPCFKDARITCSTRYGVHRPRERGAIIEQVVGQAGGGQDAVVIAHRLSTPSSMRQDRVVVRDGASIPGGARTTSLMAG